MNGLLLVDKQPGMTSHDVVNRVRRLYGEQSVGHLGTLDPLASGLLPLLLGKFTRLAQYYSKQQKEYEGRIRFGFSTDTYDSEGAATSPPQRVTLEAAWLQGAVARRKGVIEQMPPPYSAKKIHGVPAYKLARKGGTPELQPVRIQIDKFQVEVCGPDAVTFTVRISSGGYIRSLAHDVGQELGCGAHLAELRRTAVGKLRIDEAVTLDALAELGAGERESMLRGPNHVLPDLPMVQVDRAKQARLCNGMQMNLPDFSDAPLIKIVSEEGEIIAIAKRLAGTLFAPQTVLA